MKEMQKVNRTHRDTSDSVADIVLLCWKHKMNDNENDENKIVIDIWINWLQNHMF